MDSVLFNEEEALKKLKHYLPAQAPLKDFVHHNTLHAFQEMKFEDALRYASRMFAYKVSLSMDEYRELYKKHRIREDILEDRIIKRKGKENADEWAHKLFHKDYDTDIKGRIGSLRRKWERAYKVDVHAEVEIKLFKILNSYLDQGISIWKFPTHPDGFLPSIRELENESITSFFKSKKGKSLIKKEDITIKELLDILIADEELYERYLFDQQFSHPGWSGMVSFIEKKPDSLLDYRKISLKDVIILELILEIDALEKFYNGKWKPLSEVTRVYPLELFNEVAMTEKHEALVIWQEAFEWSYYDQVLAGIIKMRGKTSKKENNTFQALFCIDDREEPIRRHIENLDLKCETYGTPGHFGLAFYYQPSGGNFHTKVCPGSITPLHLIKEIGEAVKITKDIHFSKATHHPILGALSSVSVGFLSAFRLFANIFSPSMSPSAASSFQHMGKSSSLTVENTDSKHRQDDLQIGYTLDEMITSVENVIKSIGLVKDFGNIVYIIGHGGSSINNTHYPGYDCGACSGRPGSVNARVFSTMANDPRVRKALTEKGIDIPEKTQFLGGLHDTTRDDFYFYDDDLLSEENKASHKNNLIIFEKALAMNAKERSRRFFSIDSSQSPEKIHEKVRNRSVSLFEPRPELNHATNSLCIVGRHSLNEGLFLDGRAFSNSYDYSLDPEGDLLLGILNAAGPVCGGINLEYYFSRVDNQKLGAGSKLPHNVMGLIGVSNGLEGDLRPGLPMQMIEVHDPIRLLMIVEHYPDVVLNTIKRNEATYQWFINEWVNLAVIHPDTYDTYVFKEGEFTIYHPLKKLLDTVTNPEDLAESEEETLPVYLIQK
tara:strand:- start:659 stop:3151 length:2493 start_codon:yes stop_codon:yes gene_type:complete